MVMFASSCRVARMLFGDISERARTPVRARIFGFLGGVKLKVFVRLARDVFARCFRVTVAVPTVGSTSPRDST